MSPPGTTRRPRTGPCSSWPPRPRLGKDLRLLALDAEAAPRRGARPGPRGPGRPRPALPRVRRGRRGLRQRRLRGPRSLLLQLADARSGSGFSFTDLAADRPGPASGELAAPPDAAPGGARLAAEATEADFMPVSTGCPSISPKASFDTGTARWGAPPTRRCWTTSTGAFRPAPCTALERGLAQWPRASPARPARSSAGEGSRRWTSHRPTAPSARRCPRTARPDDRRWRRSRRLPARSRLLRAAVRFDRGHPHPALLRFDSDPNRPDGGRPAPTRSGGSRPPQARAPIVHGQEHHSGDARTARHPSQDPRAVCQVRLEPASTTSVRRGVLVEVTRAPPCPRPRSAAPRASARRPAHRSSGAARRWCAAARGRPRRRRPMSAGTLGALGLAQPPEALAANLRGDLGAGTFRATTGIPCSRAYRRRWASRR